MFLYKDKKATFIPERIKAIPILWESIYKRAKYTILA